MIELSKLNQIMIEGEKRPDLTWSVSEGSESLSALLGGLISELKLTNRLDEYYVYKLFASEDVCKILSQLRDFRPMQDKFNNTLHIKKFGEVNNIEVFSTTFKSPCIILGLDLNLRKTGKIIKVKGN